MALVARHYRDPSDYWRARALIRAIFELDGRQPGDWHVGVFDYWRWHWLENVVERSPEEMCLWDTADGELVAVLNQGDPGVCHPHVHPDHRSDALADAMIATAEREYATATRDGLSTVWFWVCEEDDAFHRALVERGFTRECDGEHAVEHHGQRPLCDRLPDVPVPGGFVVRSMGDVDEHPKRSLASWRSFHPGEPEDGCDKTGAWYRNVQRAPLYRRDLDLVAVAPNGDIAAFATCYFDDVSRTGVFVLDGTSSEYQRRGLAKAAMTEALRRLQWLGATTAYVSWYDAPAGALYESVGFVERRRGRVWVKRL